LEGLRENDLLISRFFSQKIELAEVNIPLTLRAALRYIKSALRYALH
jgi:succinate dehydrogenase flavin-adding protein (antitoxin of CptAB toxin-antitoxin module)